MFTQRHVVRGPRALGVNAVWPLPPTAVANRNGVITIRHATVSPSRASKQYSE